MYCLRQTVTIKYSCAFLIVWSNRMYWEHSSVSSIEIEIVLMARGWPNGQWTEAPVATTSLNTRSKMEQIKQQRGTSSAIVYLFSITERATCRMVHYYNIILCRLLFFVFSFFFEANRIALKIQKRDEDEEEKSVLLTRIFRCLSMIVREREGERDFCNCESNEEMRRCRTWWTTKRNRIVCEWRRTKAA